MTRMQNSLTVLVSTVRSTGTTLPNKFIFADNPTSDLLHTRHLHKHNQAGRREEARHSDSEQEVESGQVLDGGQVLLSCTL
jgi:hypothetical protein